MLFGTRTPAYVSAAQPVPEAMKGLGCGVLGLWPRGPQYQGTVQAPARCGQGLFGFLFPPSPVYLAAPLPPAPAPAPDPQGTPNPQGTPDPGLRVGESRIGVEDHGGCARRHRS